MGGESAPSRVPSSEWALTLKNLFLPIFCRQCGRRLLTEENGYFCPTCWEMSPRIERPYCSVCGAPHTAVVGFGPVVNFPCAACRSQKDKRPFRRIYGAAVYSDSVAEAVKLLKFKDKQRLARPLSALMREFAQREMDVEDYDFLIPVPLHRVRERARGFNQSRLLAQEIVSAFPRARVDESLMRTRPTRVQSRAKSDAERQANVRGAFALAGGGQLRNRAVLLIDDVVTTGETVSECAKTLRAEGVSVVDVFAAALAVRTSHPAK